MTLDVRCVDIPVIHVPILVNLSLCEYRLSTPCFNMIIKSMKQHAAYTTKLIRMVMWPSMILITADVLELMHCRKKRYSWQLDSVYINYIT